MRTTRRLWRSLEAGLVSGVRAVWEEHVGEDLAVLAPFLDATDEEVACYPCPIPQFEGCPRGIYRHGDGRIEAYCRSTSSTACESVWLTKADLAVRALDFGRIVAHVAALLGLPDDGTAPIDGLLRTFLLGVQRGRGGERAVYLTLHRGAPRLSETVERVLARDTRSIVLLTGTSELPVAVAEFLRARGGRALRLVDLLAIDDTGALVATRRLAEALAADGVSDAVLVASPFAAVPADACAFVREGKTWRVAYEGLVTSVGHTVGMEYIAELLRHPHREIHSAKLRDLVAGEETRARGSAGEVLDEQALRALRERLIEIDQEIDEAADRGDFGRQEQLEEEREGILAEVRRATGLGGRRRVASDDLERARQAVSRAVHRALDAIEKEHADLARHLRLSLQVGMTLTYEPDQGLPWVVG